MLSDNEKKLVDLAASVQSHYEDLLIQLTSKLLIGTNHSSICLTGGCALNSLANQKLREAIPIPMYIHNSPGDAGSSIGAAFNAHEKTKGNFDAIRVSQHNYTGPTFSLDEVQGALDLFNNSVTYIVYDTLQHMAEIVSMSLRKKKIIAIFSGAHEWGPRALGNRSIIADPSYMNMKEIVNEKIKFREPYRPFAPVVLEEQAKEIFALRELENENDPYYRMIETCRVTNYGVQKYPAIAHIDNTARVQLIHKNSQILLKTIMEIHYKLYKSPVLLNTSFNLKGEPVVGTPLDAIRTFLISGLDHLVFDNVMVSKV